MSSSGTFVGASKAFISLLFILFIGYTSLLFVKLRKTNYGTQKSSDVNSFILHFITAVEKDFAPTLVIYVAVVTFGAFYGFMAFLGFVLLLIMFPLLVVGYNKDNKPLVKTVKIMNAIFGVIGFLDLFIDDLKSPN